MKDLDAMDSMEKILIQKAYQRQAPINGSLELLPLCNMNCDMCYVRLSKAGCRDIISVIDRRRAVIISGI